MGTWKVNGLFYLISKTEDVGFREWVTISTIVFTPQRSLSWTLLPSRLTLITLSLLLKRLTSTLQPEGTIRPRLIDRLSTNAQDPGARPRGTTDHNLKFSIPSFFLEPRTTDEECLKSFRNVLSLLETTLDRVGSPLFLILDRKDVLRNKPETGY